MTIHEEKKRKSKTNDNCIICFLEKLGNGQRKGRKKKRRKKKKKKGKTKRMSKKEGERVRNKKRGGRWYILEKIFKEENMAVKFAKTTEK